MTTTKLYPLCFTPVYKDYIWGGDRIVRQFHRPMPPGRYAESWELADHRDGMSLVAHGPLAGQSLRALCERYGEALLGAGRAADRFPLLIKLIDARERLSVQVHPNDQTAAAYGGEAKTEMWYVLAAEPGAGVYAGFRPGVTPERFQAALREKRAAELLEFLPVQAGETIFIPGGRVHAIGAGCLLWELQQNSNTTYRLYDWDRVGPDGQPRALHLAEALQVIDWSDRAEPRVAPRPLAASGPRQSEELLACPFFRLERLRFQQPWNRLVNPGSFEVLFVPAEPVRLEWSVAALELPAGSSCLIPAALGEYQLAPLGAGGEVLRATGP